MSAMAWFLCMILGMAAGTAAGVAAMQVNTLAGLLTAFAVSGIVTMVLLRTFT